VVKVVVLMAHLKICRSVPLEVVLVLCKSHGTGSQHEVYLLGRFCAAPSDSGSYKCTETRVAATVSDIYDGDTCVAY
jgi:hypothetical protein